MMPDTISIVMFKIKSPGNLYRGKTIIISDLFEGLLA